MEFKAAGNANLFRWTNDYLFQILTNPKNPILTDPKVIAAFRKVDRKDFVPLQTKERAYEDVDLDIGYNETFTRPTVLAQMMTLMKPKYGGNYLDIGTGTGFFATILGIIAGEEGHVYTIERIQWLWELARSNHVKYKNEAKNVHFLYRDGVEGLVNQSPFDAIHISFAMTQIPENLKQQLKIGGKLICPTTTNDLKVLERIGDDEYVEEMVPGFQFVQGKTGVA